MVLSTSEENYLKAIYYLQQEGAKVSTNKLAERMQTKPSSVTDMIKKFQTKKLIDYTPYYGVSLTQNGRVLALAIIRRHRLWEFFLVNTLGFSWDAVHEIAEQLEHISHPQLIDKLDVFLGNPAFDPHGDPIPDKSGNMAVAVYRKLSEVANGELVTFKSVGLQTPELMQALNHKNIKLGDSLGVVQVYAFDHSLDVRVNGSALVSISLRLANHILVF